MRPELHRAALLLALALLMMTTACSPQSGELPDGGPVLIPEGQHPGLRPLEVPRQDVDRSRFVFLATGNTSDEDGPRWYGYATEHTAYSINGSDVALEDFERALADTGAYQFDVHVETRGEFETINAILPEVEE
ncbi:MAG: hypothetical protein Q7W51_07865 [Coriobacteriia bacterium]|nr:hypothetical protein [Coriobacteriia bacterium]